MISTAVKFTRLVKGRKDSSQEPNLEQNQENRMSQEDSDKVEEPPSIDNLLGQEGPALPRNLNTLVINVHAYKDVLEEEKKVSNNIYMNAIW